MSVRNDKKAILAAVAAFPEGQFFYGSDAAVAIGVKYFTPHQRVMYAVMGKRFPDGRNNRRIEAAFNAARKTIYAHNRQVRELRLAELDAMGLRV